MKVLIFLIICLVEASRGDDRQTCEEGYGCDSSKECCLRSYYNKKCTFCGKFSDLGELCVDDLYSRNQPADGVFTGKCPCKPGLYCDQLSRICKTYNRKACYVLECETSTDCPRGQCCVTDFSVNSPSYCAPFTNNGDLCFTDLVSQSLNQTFMGKCPCQPGFECDNFNGRGDKECFEIEKPPERTNKSCDTGDDCSDSECCVSDSEEEDRECRPLLRYGQKCDRSSYARDKPTVYDSKCPCKKPAICAKRCFE